MLKLAQPAIAGSLAWVALSEGVTLAQVLGGMLTVDGAAGAVLTAGGRRFARGPAPQEMPR